MKRYTLAVTDPKYWNEIHGSLIVDSNNDGIPDRQVTCSDSKEHSPTRGTYELTEEEAAEIANHPHVKWIELSPTDNPDNYPKPQPATKRFRKNVKIYRDLNGGYGPTTSSPTSAEIGRTNWALKRVGIHSNGDFWPVTSYTGNIQSLNGDTSYSLTGKNVDLVIHDSGVMQYHPEFIDGNGKSRVRDIVLDGPYYIDPDYFNSNNYTYVKMDGRIGITTTSAHNWWENSSLRSAAFSSVGTVWISSNYTVNRSMGDVGTTNALTSGHGTGAAGVSAGNNFGLAFEANIWNMPGISDNVGMGPEANYDLIKIFHKYKPINPETGVKNPTLVNGSWGHQAGFSSNDTVSYKFRGSTGTFTGNDAVTNQVTAWKEGFNNQILGAYKSWSSSARSNSTDTAGNEMMAEGVIYVAAAGNNNQRMGIGRSDPDRLNYMEDEWFNVGDPRSEFPGLACPSNHRDWMNPQGIGFDEANDYHPVICVGCVDEYVDTTTKQERKADYSNNGPGIDIWGFGDEALSAGLSGDSSYEDFPRYSSSGPTYYDCLYNGTSSAAPTIAGLIALYLETNPTADSRDVKKWLNNHASRIVDDGEYQDVQSDDTTTAYWTGGYNMRGAEKRLPIDPYASDAIPSIKSGSKTSGESIIKDSLYFNFDASNIGSIPLDQQKTGMDSINDLVTGNTFNWGHGKPEYTSEDFGGSTKHFSSSASNADSFDLGNLFDNSNFNWDKSWTIEFVWKQDTVRNGIGYSILGCENRYSSYPNYDSRYDSYRFRIAAGWASGTDNTLRFHASISDKQYANNGLIANWTDCMRVTDIIPADSWNHHTVVFDIGNQLGGGAKIKYYINGQEGNFGHFGENNNGSQGNVVSQGNGGAQGGSDNHNSSDFHICGNDRVGQSHPLGSNGGEGWMGLMRVYTRPFTPEEVVRNFDATKNRFPIVGNGNNPNTTSNYPYTYKNDLKITSISTNPTKGASVAPTAWASGTEAENNIWQDVAYGNGRFVAVSSDGTNRVMSSLNGIDWTTHLVNTLPWYAVIYANNMFVAVATGNSNTNRVMYSSTGTSWTSTSLQDENSFTMYDNCIAYGAGKFVIVGVMGADNIRYSTTGTSWTKGSASESSGWRGIAYGNGYFVSTAVTGTNRVMRSTNGTSWSSITGTTSGNDWVGHYNIAYGNGTFVTTSSSATNSVKYSTNNGATWTAISVSGAGYSVRYIEDTSGTGYFISSSAYSTDGINWSSGVYAGNKIITDGNDLAVAVSSSGVKYYNMRETNYDPPGQLKLFYK